MVNDAAVKRLFKDFDQLLLIHLEPLSIEALNDFFVFQPFCFPFKGFFDQLSFFVDRYFSITVDFYYVIALWYPSDPLALFKFFLHAGNGPLLAKLVVKLRKQKLNVLVQHAAGIGRIGRLGYRKYTHAVLFSKVLGQFDRPTTRAGKPVQGIHQDMGDLATMLFDKLQHPLEFLSPVGFGTLISASKVAQDGQVLFGRIVFNGFTLKVQGEVVFCLFFGGNPGIHNGSFGIHGNDLGSTFHIVSKLTELIERAHAALGFLFALMGTILFSGLLSKDITC